MKTMKTKIIFSLLIVLFTVSCNEDILDVQNENAYNGDTFFTTPAAYEEAATAMYTPLLHNGMYAREFYFIFDLLGNDADKNFPLQGGLLDFPLYTHTPNNGEITALFNACYKMVFRTNFVIDLMEKWEPVADNEIAQKKRIYGEALFLKSFANFLLVNLWGDVPLKTSVEDHEELHAPRTPKAEVWAAIEADLKEAIIKLPVSYDSDSDYGRATQGAAVALLGKSYLYQKKYSEAIDQLSKLGSGSYNYGLAGNLDDLFVNDIRTNETVFAVMHAEWQGWGVGNAYYVFGGQELWGGRATHGDRAMEYGFNDWWNVLLSDALVDAFNYKDESNADYSDPRAALTYYSKDGNMGGDPDYVAGPYDLDVISWRKYQRYENIESEGLPQSPINSHIIRYADVMLFLAEAYIENGQVSDALPLINQVRARSGAFEYSNLGSQDQARTILRHERQIELAGEQSRFFDLVGWGILVETINSEKSEQPAKDYHVLLPIPQAERDANPVLNAQVNNNWN
jgi:hypothetical protein